LTHGWSVHRATGSAADFHARPWPDPLTRAVHVLDVDRPALVLGSTQRDDAVDALACRRAGVEVVRRSSGGGAVLLDPGAVVWLDIELPRGDPLWDDDVGRAAWWVGEACASAIGGGEVHRGGLVPGQWGHLVCFAGLGPGEVTIGGRKAAGVSQRRTRAGARFQCAVARSWDPARLASLLALAHDDRDALAADLADAVRVVDLDVDDLLAQLP
jgi:lipoate-protein ligase A